MTAQPATLTKAQLRQAAYDAACDAAEYRREARAAADLAGKADREGDHDEAAWQANRADEMDADAEEAEAIAACLAKQAMLARE